MAPNQRKPACIDGAWLAHADALALTAQTFRRSESTSHDLALAVRCLLGALLLFKT